MANQNHLIDETRKVLELTEESEEKVSLLQRDLKHTESLYEQLTKDLNNVQNLKIKYSAELEDDQILKNNIKEYNEKLINFAQQIFSCGQKLYTELNLREHELDNIEKTFSTNEEKYLAKIKIYNDEEEKCKVEQKLFRKKNTEEKERRRQEEEKLRAENKSLTKRLNDLKDSLKQHEANIQEKEANIIDEEIKLKQEIINIKDKIKLKDVEINKVNKLTEDTEKDKDMCDIIFRQSITELDRKAEETEKEVLIAANELKTKETQYNEIMEKLLIVNDEYESKETIYKRQVDLLKELETMVDERIQEIIKENDYYANIILEHEETKKLHLHLKTKLEVEINSLKSKIAIVDEDLNKTITDINDIRAKLSTTDLNTELDSKRSELQQLKNTRQELKQIYNQKSSAIQSEIEILQGEISSIELNNKKLQQEIDNFEIEIKQARNSIDTKINEKFNEEQLSRQFETQMQSLSKQIATFKSESNKVKFKSVHREVHEHKDLSNSSTSIEKKFKVHRHRDRFSQAKDQTLEKNTSK